MGAQHNRTLAMLGTAAVAAHAIIAALHGMAHTDLGIQMNAAQTAFIDVVIVATPIIAAIALWTRFAHAGAIVLAVSMTGSLLFGVYHHYVAISPDHVAHLPAGNLQGLFRVTAVLLVISEAFGAGVGVWGAQRAS
jgi:hypothetical protein